MSRLAFVLYALSFALMTGGFLLVVRWLVNDFRIRTELRWEAEMEARGFELAEAIDDAATEYGDAADLFIDQLCGDIAEEESRYLQTEWWLLNRGGQS